MLVRTEDRSYARLCYDEVVEGHVVGDDEVLLDVHQVLHAHPRELSELTLHLREKPLDGPALD